MGKLIKILVLILMTVSMITGTISSVKADFCDDTQTDPKTGIVVEDEE